MLDLQNYPWYIQRSPTFSKLYNGVFSAFAPASPLGLGDYYDIDKLTGKALYNFGTIVGVRGNPFFPSGLIYNVDKWSETKVWSGDTSDIEEDTYRNYVKLKAFLQAQSVGFLQNFSLNLLKEAISILLKGHNYTVSVDEEFMSFTINITSDEETLRILQQLQSFDKNFFGKPTGILYKFNYIQTNQAAEEG